MDPLIGEDVELLLELKTKDLAVHVGLFQPLELWKEHIIKPLANC
jgi:hypothetical protein